MLKLSYESILRNLKKEGLRTCKFSVVSEGEYTAEDADWNYKDIPHLSVVHRLADTTPILVGSDIICTINLQNILGMWFPITLVNYQKEKNTQIYYTTLLFFILVVETKISEPQHLLTQVKTTYTIGYPKWLFFLVPILRWLVKRNYRVLMGEDLPMRERRGELRKLGYSFKKSRETYSFLETMKIHEEHLLPPINTDRTYKADYQKELKGLTKCYLGDKGLFGLVLTRVNNEITIWPRTCPHEGASLEAAVICKKEEVVLCPWHGRRIKALGKFNFNQNTCFENKNYHIFIHENIITWTYRDNPLPNENLRAHNTNTESEIFI